MWDFYVLRYDWSTSSKTRAPTIRIRRSGITAKYAVGKEVELEMDVGERDKFKRLVAYVWVDGQILNQMLRKGD